jgi:hypothetical protein
MKISPEWGIRWVRRNAIYRGCDSENSHAILGSPAIVRARPRNLGLRRADEGPGAALSHCVKKKRGQPDGGPRLPSLVFRL